MDETTVMCLRSRPIGPLAQIGIPRGVLICSPAAPPRSGLQRPRVVQSPHSWGYVGCVVRGFLAPSHP